METNLSQKSVELLKKHGFNNNLHLFEISGNVSCEINESYKNNNFILEAKKVILEEQYDKLSNMQLRKIVAEEIDDQLNDENDTNEETLTVNKSLKEVIDLENTGHLEILTKQKLKSNFTSENYLKKYFQKWKQFTFNECLKLENKVLINKKLNKLLETINAKKHKSQCTQNIQNGSVNIKNHPKLSSAIFVNRYNAQKNIIQQQKEKLQEQQRLIEELKFNKIKHDTETSIEQSKYEIQNIFKNCSNNVKCKVGKIIENSTEDSNPLEDSLDENIAFHLKSFQIPKMVRAMEKRAMERDLNRQIIKERKRILDENRKKLAEELLDKKRFLDEDETKHNLEIMKEKRRKEIEKEKVRQKNKEAYLRNCNIADKFYDFIIVRLYFECWLRLITMKEFNETKAECHYDRKFQIKCFNALLLYSRENVAHKQTRAINIYNFKLKKYYMSKLRLLLRQKRRNFQVAQDFYYMKLEQRIFIQWHRNICQLQMVELKLIKRADMHYLRKIKFYYFYQWRTLPVVMLLEKTKEERRMKWRRKVLEVLPDYKPPMED